MFEEDVEFNEFEFTEPNENHEDPEYDDGVVLVCYNGCTFCRCDGSSRENCHYCGDQRPLFNMWKCSCETLCYGCYQQRKADFRTAEAEKAAEQEAQKARIAKLSQEVKLPARKSQLQWGHGYDASQGATREWPGTYYHIKPVDVGKKGVITSVGMRFNANPTRGVRIKLAVFSCTNAADKNVCSLGKVVTRVRGIIEMDGTEQGVNEFPLENPVSLTPGRYYILIYLDNRVAPNSFFDHIEAAEYLHCSFYATDSAGIDRVLTPEHNLPTTWTPYQSRMSWWLNGKNDVHPRQAYTPFIELLQHHLTPKLDKTYFPPFPEGWNEDEQVKLGVLSVACELGSALVVEYLLKDETVKPDDFFNAATALMVSALFGHTAIVSMLLEKKANVLLKSESDCSLGGGRDALLFACSGAKNNSADVVRVLLENKASVESVDENNRSCLHLASSVQGSEAVVPLLLGAGASLEQQDAFGETALLCACSKNNPTIVNLLLAAGADLFVTDKAGRTGLHLACYFGATTVTQTLLEAKATCHVDRKDQEGLTPLSIAAARSYSDISSLLKNAYAGLGYSVCWGLTAGDGARHHIESEKLSCIRINVPVESIASHVGICFFESAEWGGEGDVRVGLFADKEGFPDVSELLARGQGNIDSLCKGRETLFALDKLVPLTQGRSYWAAFVSSIMTVVAKDARVKEKNRTYLQCASLETCWTDAKSDQWKQHQCSLALFIRTRSTNDTSPQSGETINPDALPNAEPAISIHTPLEP